MISEKTEEDKEWKWKDERRSNVDEDNIATGIKSK